MLAVSLSALSPLGWSTAAFTPAPLRAASAVRFAGSAVQMAEPDYDLLIVGCGVGGHGAALHAVSKGMKVAVVAGNDVGGTCVNRGCVPSKALLAASGKVREMGNEDHLAAMGIKTGGVSYEREKVAAHANNLASKVAKNLGGSLDALGVKVFEEKGQLVSPTEVKLVGTSNTVTAKNVILATGSVPFVPPGVETDGKTVFTSDEALKLEWVPDYIAIIGSGYIGLEFSDVYTALGSEVTFIEAMPRIMFFFDKQIAQLAERILIRPRNIDYRTNVFASKVTPGVPGVKPVTIEMIDANTKEHVETLEVDACMVCTGRAPYSEGLGLGDVGVHVNRGFVQVDEKMRALDEAGNVIDGLWAIGDLNGKMMLAHAASAQGISAVENMCGTEHVLNHDAIPAACFTHPEIAMVGPTEEQAREKAEKEVRAAAPLAAGAAAPMAPPAPQAWRRRGGRSPASPRWLRAGGGGRGRGVEGGESEPPNPPSRCRCHRGLTKPSGSRFGRGSRSASRRARSRPTRRRWRRARARASPRSSSARTRTRSSPCTSSASTPPISSRSVPTPSTRARLSRTSP